MGTCQYCISQVGGGDLCPLQTAPWRKAQAEPKKLNTLELSPSGPWVETHLYCLETDHRRIEIRGGLHEGDNRVLVERELSLSW